MSSAATAGQLRAQSELLDDRSLVDPEVRVDRLFGRALRRGWSKVSKVAERGDGNRRIRHKLRVRIKRLRYMLEASDPDISSEPGSKPYKSLLELQDCLGELNDIAQTREWLRQQSMPASLAKSLQASLLARRQMAQSRVKRARRKLLRQIPD